MVGHEALVERIKIVINTIRDKNNEISFLIKHVEREKGKEPKVPRRSRRQLERREGEGECRKQATRKFQSRGREEQEKGRSKRQKEMGGGREGEEREKGRSERSGGARGRKRRGSEEKGRKREREKEEGDPKKENKPSSTGTK
jgi:hypothetical protein